MSFFISKKRLIYILFYLIFGLWALFSNLIIANVLGISLQREDFETYKNSTTDVVVAIDSISIGEDIFQTCMLAGWAVGSSGTDNINRHTKYIFTSGANTYSVEAELNERPDIRSIFASTLPENSTYDLGAIAAFTPITMKDGVYDLYVYCQENTQDYGISYTGKRFLKAGKSFSEYIFQSEEIQSITAKELLTNSAVDDVQIADNMLEISGWGYIDNMDCMQQKVYVQLDNGTAQKTYTTEKIDRPDVAKGFGNQQYTLSGYRTKISLEDLVAGTYQLGLLVKNGDTIAGTIKGTVQIDEDGDVSYTTAKDIIKTFESEKVENLIAQEDLVYSSVDLVSNNNTMLEIVGWGFIENMDCSQQTVYVKLNGGTGSGTYTTEQKIRSDVAEGYKNEQYAASGYSAEIPLKQLGAGSYQLELFVKNGDTIASAIKGTVRIAEDDTIMYTKA